MIKEIIIKEITFGALAPSLKEQGVSGPYVDSFQKDADAIAHLHQRLILTDAEARKARKRLMVNIIVEDIEG